MLGDREWLDDLGYAYQQHLSNATRYDRESLPFEKWAVVKVWPTFVNLARFCTVIPPYTLKDWATAEPSGGGGYESSCLARSLMDAPILVKAALTYIYKRSRSAHGAVREHIDKGKVYPGNERALGKGKRLVYDYLKQAAETEACLTRG